MVVRYKIIFLIHYTVLAPNNMSLNILFLLYFMCHMKRRHPWFESVGRWGCYALEKVILVPTNRMPPYVSNDDGQDNHREENRWWAAEVASHPPHWVGYCWLVHVKGIQVLDKILSAWIENTRDQLLEVPSMWMNNCLWSGTPFSLKRTGSSSAIIGRRRFWLNYFDM